MKNQLLTIALISLFNATATDTLWASDSQTEVQEESWSSLVTKFTEAFDSGDTATLEALKSSWASKGFANINDLGGKFMKYGGGMDKWDQLIEDAGKNVPMDTAWSSLVTKFTEAFDSGDTATLEALKSSWASKGFANINDLGGKFMKYGGGMDKWDQLIEDAAKNGKK